MAWKFEKQVQVFFSNKYLPCGIHHQLKDVYKLVTLHKVGNKLVGLLFYKLLLTPTYYQLYITSFTCKHPSTDAFRYRVSETCLANLNVVSSFSVKRLISILLLRKFGDN